MSRCASVIEATHQILVVGNTGMVDGMTNKRRQQMRPAIVLGGIFVLLWLSGLVGSPLFERENSSSPGDARKEIPAPVLATDVPPAAVLTVTSGRQGDFKWSMVVSADRGMRCFGLSVDNATHRQDFACNRRVLQGHDAFGGILLAPSELPKPILLGEVAEGVANVEAMWERNSSKVARTLEQYGGFTNRLRPFAIVLPRHIQRLRLVARDAESNVVGLLRVCCPLTGVRSAPILPLCHGNPMSRVPTSVRRGSVGGLEELMACPPVDLVRGVEFFSSSYD
jgi:hypothetical protein